MALLTKWIELLSERTVILSCIVVIIIRAHDIIVRTESIIVRTDGIIISVYAIIVNAVGGVVGGVVLILFVVIVCKKIPRFARNDKVLFFLRLFKFYNAYLFVFCTSCAKYGFDIGFYVYGNVY